MNYDTIIVNYNGEKIISKCLESIFNSSARPEKIIIYDNASSDRSIDEIKKFQKKYQNIILIRSKANKGYARACNYSLSRVESDYVMIMNNDLFLEKNCTKELIEYIERNEKVVLANPLIYQKDERKDFIYSFGAEINTAGFGISKTDVKKNNDELSCFSGACFLCRAEFIKQNKLEENFFLYYEEPELSIRILSQGKKIGRTNKAVCYHLGNYSSKGEGVCFRQFFAIQNRFYMLGKYWPFWLLIKALPFNIFHLFYNCLIFIRNKRFSYLSLIYLAPFNLLEGRKSFYGRKKVLWINKLEKVSLLESLRLKKQLYGD